MIEMISSVVEFPSGGGIQGAVFSVLGWIYSWMGNYGMTIIFFAFLLRLMMSPLDFGTKYFTKKNSINMAKMKPEMDEIARTHGDDPVAMNRARSALMRKHGGGMGGFCLFTLLNLVIMLLVFINVFQALNATSNFNINHQYTKLQEVYAHYQQAGTLKEETSPGSGEWVASQAFITDINQTHAHYNVGFLWVFNIWRSDTPWTTRTLDFNSFRSVSQGVQGGVLSDGEMRRIFNEEVTAGNWQENEFSKFREQFISETREQYDFIFGNIEGSGKAWNGFLLLILAAGGATFLSAWLNMKFNKQTKVLKEGEKKEEISYSVRGANSGQGENKTPQLDPATMGRIMKFVMPAVMMAVALTFTAALAVYIIVGSLVHTAIGFGFNVAIEKILKKQQEKKKETGPDMTVINPHAKYFKKG